MVGWGGREGGWLVVVLYFITRILGPNHDILVIMSEVEVEEREVEGGGDSH